MMTLSRTSLAWLTLGEKASPLTLIDSAHDAGFGQVGLKVVPNAGSAMPSIADDQALFKAVKSRLAATGVSVVEMGGAWLSPGFDVLAVDAALEAGRELGAQFVIAAGSDPVQSRLIDHLATLTRRAELIGLKVAIEFIPFSTIPDLRTALRLTECVGSASCGILVDALHLNRCGDTPADLAMVPPSAIFLAHLCDAPLRAPSDLRRESREDRYLPGEGQLALFDFLDALPSDVLIEIEAPVFAYRSLLEREVAQRTAMATTRFYSGYAARPRSMSRRI